MKSLFSIFMMAFAMFCLVFAAPFPSEHTPRVAAISETVELLERRLENFCSQYSEDSIVGLACTQADKIIHLIREQIEENGDKVVDYTTQTIGKSEQTTEKIKNKLSDTLEITKNMAGNVQALYIQEVQDFEQRVYDIEDNLKDILLMLIENNAL